MHETLRRRTHTARAAAELLPAPAALHLVVPAFLRLAHSFPSVVARPCRLRVRPPRPRRSRLAVALAAAWLLAGAPPSFAADVTGAPATGKPADTAPTTSTSTATSTASTAAPAGLSLASDKEQPVYLSAREVRNQLDQETVAEGEVELRQAGLLLTADSLRYLQATQLAIATGNVRLARDGDSFVGSQAQLQLDSRRGYVLDPVYHFARTGAGGQAKRIDFVGSDEIHAVQANYTSCPRDGSGDPAWLLSAAKIDLDFAHNEGHAEGAVLRFLGVPILAAPALSFPTSNERKSGWLPPSLSIDNRAGVDVSVPYYLNIAPNLDATLTPSISTRRGVGAEGEFRYLFTNDSGRIDLQTVPWDSSADRARSSQQFEHEGSREILGGGLRYSASVQHASDDDYWKDFSHFLPSLTQRLLPMDLQVAQRWEGLRLGAEGSAGVEVYARVQGWQVLQDTETILPPYQRLPQVGVRLSGEAWQGLRYDFVTEANRFVLSDQPLGDARPDGNRVHALGSLSRPFDPGWGWLTPHLAFNAASYSTDTAMSDGRRNASRVIPTLSVDGGLRFEKDTHFFGHDLRQVLEPRMHYVNTPRRDQTTLPLFDTAASDFNEISIYADNAFTGIDRVSDAHQLTLGATTRFLERSTGVERLRLGVAQRYQFREEQLTPDGVSTTSSRFSDLLLFGSATLVPNWRFDGTVQYNPDDNRVARSIVSTRYQPAPFHTIAATYRFARQISEQFELGWQWPVYRGGGGSQGKQGQCEGTLYGVGRVNYSMKDSRITDSLLGVEYDAGCWIGRVVAQRVSTGRTEATTQLMLQLELIGLSKLGTNPLKVLKDNIPGYQLLRDDDAPSSSTVNP